MTQVRTHLGYMPFEGRLRPHPTEPREFHAEIARTNLQPVNKITCVFDPFTEDYYSLRNYMYFVNRRKTKVNVLCIKLLVDIGCNPDCFRKLTAGASIKRMW